MINREFKGPERPTRRLARWEGSLWIVSIVVVLAVGGVLSRVFWDDLHDSQESLSSTVRNLGLVIGAVVAALLAVWRSRVAERQANAAHRQVETAHSQLEAAHRQVEAAHRQVEAAQQGLSNERYQKGAEMLGSDVLSVRLGGIYALQRLANEHPQEYHVQIMRLLCAFVRNPTAKGNGEAGLADHRTGEVAATYEDRGGARPRQDVEAVMEAIATRSKIGIDLERAGKFQLDLRGAKLGGLNLINFEHVNLSWANLSYADLSCANLRPLTDMSWIHAVSVNLSSACLVDVNLAVTQFWGADLSGALLQGADLSGAAFSDLDEDTPCRMTQAQLDSACADSNRPPHLVGVVDAETGDPLVWRDKPLDEDA